MGHSRRSPLWAGMLVVAAQLATSASPVLADFCASGLASPYAPAPMAISQKPKDYECDAVIAPVVSLGVESKYDQGDANKDKLDAEAKAAYDAGMSNLRAYQKQLINAANTVYKSEQKRQSAAECATGYLLAWAREDALSDLETDTAKQNRSPLLASFALGYLQVRDQISDAEERREITDWLVRQAEDMTTYFDGRSKKTSARNNHRYWAGLAAAAVGTAANRCDLYKWGVDSAKVGLRQVDTDGFLPLEIERGSRAREYHLYALGPLVLLAGMEAKQGRDLLAYNKSALRRLISATLASLHDPLRIATAAGEPQIPLDGDKAMPAPHRIAWFEVLADLAPELLINYNMNALRPLGFSSLGGNLTALYLREEE